MDDINSSSCQPPLAKNTCGMQLAAVPMDEIKKVVDKLFADKGQAFSRAQLNAAVSLLLRTYPGCEIRRLLLDVETMLTVTMPTGRTVAEWTRLVREKLQDWFESSAPIIESKIRPAHPIFHQHSKHAVRFQ